MFDTYFHSLGCVSDSPESKSTTSTWNTHLFRLLCFELTLQQSLGCKRISVNERMVNHPSWKAFCHGLILLVPNVSSVTWLRRKVKKEGKPEQSQTCFPPGSKWDRSGVQVCTVGNKIFLQNSLKPQVAAYLNSFYRISNNISSKKCVYWSCQILWTMNVNKH